MAAKFELPSTLTNALAGFAFTGKTLWTLSEGRRNVKLEITLLLQDPRKRPTNQQARAVQDTAATPTVKQPEQPRETPPPSTSQMTAEAATVNYRRPASTAAIPPSPAIQQPTPQPIVRRKIQRASTPLPSTQHQPMEVTATDLDKCVSQPPEPRYLPHKTEQLPVINMVVRYEQEQAYEHHERRDFIIIKTRQLKHPEDKTPVFYVNTFDKRQPWYMFKGPRSKRYYLEWWDYLESYTSTATPLPQKERKKWTEEFASAVTGHKRKKQKLLRPVART